MNKKDVYTDVGQCVHPHEQKSGGVKMTYPPSPTYIAHDVGAAQKNFRLAIFEKIRKGFRKMFKKDRELQAEEFKNNSQPTTQDFMIYHKNEGFDPTPEVPCYIELELPRFDPSYAPHVPLKSKSVGDPTVIYDPDANCEYWGLFDFGDDRPF